MKKKFLNYCINLIDENQNNISKEKLEEIKYGLEGVYLTLTKTIIIFSISLVLNIFKETLILLFIFNLLRLTAFGLHATKSWICWLISITFFIILPIISKILIIPLYLKYALCIFCIVIMFLYAPADTIKHPLVNRKKRNLWKTITVFNSILLSFIVILYDDQVLCNLIIFGIYLEVLLINPISYKIFRFKYNNYKDYNSLLGSNA